MVGQERWQQIRRLHFEEHQGVSQIAARSQRNYKTCASYEWFGPWSVRIVRGGPRNRLTRSRTRVAYRPEIP